MKRCKTYAIVMVTLIGLVFEFPQVSFGQQNSSKDIDVMISLDKETYLLSEPIWVDMSVKNIGADSIKILPLVLRCMECLQIVLFNSKGDTLPYSGVVHDLTRTPTGYLTGPGKTRSNYANLLQGFGEKLDGFGMRRFLKSDRYSIVAVYANMVKSNKVEFEVKKPKGEEQVTHDLLHEAYYYDIKLDNQKTIDILQKLIEAYPKSVYADLAYYEIARHYGAIGEPEEAHGCFRKLILSYPNSHFALRALRGLLGQMTEDEKREFFEKIIKKYPKTRSADWAKESLKVLEKEGAKEK